MTKKHTKKALLTSVLALVLCFAMLLGTTFAWFTDNANTGINKITSGNLDLVVEHLVGQEWVAIDAATDLFRNVSGEPIQWEPGAEAQELFRIRNAGTLALKYNFAMNTYNAQETPQGKTLKDALSLQVVTGANFNNQGTTRPGIYEGVYFDAESPDNGAPFAGFTGFEEYLLPGESRELYCTIQWRPGTNDNAFNVAGGLSIDLGISVAATQYTYEVDGASNEYDAGATYDEITMDPNAIAIGTAEELFDFARQVNVERKTFAGKTVKLTNNIDLEGAAWTPIGQTATGIQFQGTFDGNGYTISNLNVAASSDATDGHGLFGWLYGDVKNLTIDGATINGHHYVGVIAGYVEFGTIGSCTVKHATITAPHIDDNLCGDKVGGITGYLAPNSQARVVSCRVEDSTISAGRDAGQVVGAVSNTMKDTVTGCSASGVSVTANGGCTGKNINNDIIGRLY